jgi:hypothetical protein
MTNLADALTGLGDALAQAVAAASIGLPLETDEGLLAVLAGGGRVQRLAESLIVLASAQILERDDARAHPDRVTTRHGCRNLSELIQRATRTSGRTASAVLATAKAVQQQRSMSTGEALPAELPALREALLAGDVGVDGISAVVAAFRGCRAGRTGVLAADEELAAAARGAGVDAAPPASADELRAVASVWAVYLDQDGFEPDDARAMRKRGFTVGRRTEDGLVPVRGNLLPEVAAQLQLGFDSVLNPRVAAAATSGPCFDGGRDQDRDRRNEPVEAAADQRTSAQKQHDALAALLTAAAASGDLPMLGGAAPTLTVSVREEDLATGRGFAHLPGDDAPVPIAVARQIACAGSVQRVVLGANGRITSIVTLDRVFNHHQRRAITLRDGGCVIPGCHVRPQWCEIHHVEEHSRGGPTHTDNGVLLCWFHHRTIDTGGWEIRMSGGIPHVRGPYWWDAHRTWRPATKSPTRKLDRLAHGGSG